MSRQNRLVEVKNVAEGVTTPAAAIGRYYQMQIWYPVVYQLQRSPIWNEWNSLYLSTSDVMCIISIKSGTVMQESVLLYFYEMQAFSM